MEYYEYKYFGQTKVPKYIVVQSDKANPVQIRLRLNLLVRAEYLKSRGLSEEDRGSGRTTEMLIRALWTSQYTPIVIEAASTQHTKWIANRAREYASQLAQIFGAENFSPDRINTLRDSRYLRGTAYILFEDHSLVEQTVRELQTITFKLNK